MFFGKFEERTNLKADSYDNTLPQLSVFRVAHLVIFVLLFLHRHFVPHLVTWSRALLLQSLCQL